MNGGNIFGEYPIFEAASLAEIDVGQGRLIPQLLGRRVPLPDA